MINRGAVLLAVFGLVACDRPTAPTSLARSAPHTVTYDNAANTTQSETEDISGVIVSPCTGEPIAYQGSAHLVVSLQQTETGQELTTHFNTQNLSGIGQVTGTKYQISDVFSEDETTQTMPASGSADVAEHFRVVSDGSLDNFLVDLVYSITFPPLQFTYQTKNSRCQG